MNLPVFGLLLFRLTAVSLAIGLCVGLAGCSHPDPSAEVTAPAPHEPAYSGATGVRMSGGDSAQLDRLEFPTLRITTLDGGSYDLAEHRGHWVVVNFWATWCAPCLREMPELSDLHARHAEIDVIGLAYEEIGTEQLRAFLAERPVSYPVALVDVAAPPPDFATPRGLPTTYLIAPNGQVARQYLAPLTAQQIEDLIAEMADVGKEA